MPEQAPGPEHEATFPDVSELKAEKPTHAELLGDPKYISISLRRHGAYERGDKNPIQRGQLTKETFGGVREAADAWVADLPEGAEVSLIASPTYMPAQRPIAAEARERHPEASERIEPRRASVTSSLYAAALRRRFGDEFGGYLATEDLSERGQEIRDQLEQPEPPNARHLDSRLGDIFENTTKEESEFVPEFFKKLSETYGGLTPDFWRDYIRGSLPAELNEVYLKAGGDPAVEKAAMTLDTIGDLVSRPHGETKQVALMVSHEEVIGSLAYQILDYIKANNLAEEDVIAQLDSTKIGYNQGFDIHVGAGGKAFVEVAGVDLQIDLNELTGYVKNKVNGTPQ
jgi:hypothetical protein